MTNGTINQELFNDVFDYLYEVTGNQFDRNSKFLQNKFQNLVNQGYKYEHFKSVIDKKWTDWKDTPYRVYVRPETLFGYNFQKYLHEQRSTTNVQKLHNAVQKAKSAFGGLDKK